MPHGGGAGLTAGAAEDDGMSETAAVLYLRKLARTVPAGGNSIFFLGGVVPAGAGSSTAPRSEGERWTRLSRGRAGTRRSQRGAIAVLAPRGTRFAARNAA